MLDNALFALILLTLKSGLQSIGQNGITVVQNNQPTQQGTPSGPSIFIYKVSDERMGFPQRISVQGSGAASFTASIAGNVLTVSSVASGALAANQLISGTGLPSNVIITSLGTGTGGAGTYILNYAPGTLSARAMTSIGAQGYTETQQYISTFQMSALATQDPSNVESLTASDILNYGVYVMQTGSTIASFEAQGVGILNIAQVRNPYFSDDRVRYEASPSCDFRLTHKQIVTSVIPVILSDELQVLSV
jgi:hypothetical protein